jgi:hypothetical protein
LDPTPDVEITSLLADLAREVQALRTSIHQEQRRLLKEWDPYLQNRHFLPGAANLAAYICLRRRDMRDLQSRLGAFGLSSLGRSEGRVLATLDSVYQALKVMLGKRADPVHMKQLMDSLCCSSTPSGCWVMPPRGVPCASWSPCHPRPRMTICSSGNW